MHSDATYASKCMRLVNTWNCMKLLLTLLLLPVVALGGVFSVCSDHNEIVYVGTSCNGSYWHEHEGDDQEQPHEHHCTQVENEALPFAQVQVPAFEPAAVPVEVPDFRSFCRRMRSLVSLTMERTERRVPPKIRTAPLLI